MKNIFTYLFTALFSIACCNVSAQNKPEPLAGKIYGTITDSVSSEPLSFTTLHIKTEKDSLIKTIISKTDGKFIIENLKIAKYHLAIISTGYQEKVITIEAGVATINLGAISLSKRINNLKEVEVTADRPIIQQKADRIIYDMQADPENKVNSVLSMIHKIPYLSLDADDNVQMKGNSSFKVLINGKPSGMLTNNLKEILRSMPASTVLRIEVITIPPSKYDAEGLAGIINIITDRKIGDGYKGTFNVNDNLPQGGPGIGTSFTIQQGKFGMNGYGGASIYNSPQTNYTTSRVTTDTNATNLKQSGYNKSNSKNAYFGSELSYEIDSLNLISGNFNINGNRYNGTGYQTSTLNGTTGLLQGYNINSDNYGNGGGFDAAINYQLGFKSSKNTLLTFSYQYSDYGNGSYNDIDVSDPFDYTTPDYRQADNQDSKEQTFQLDYVQPIKKVNMELGVKAILRSSKSDFEYRSLDSATNTFQIDPTMGNVFNYTQDVFGAYNSYQFSIKKWSFSGGLRAEQTDVNADFISNASSTKQNYFNVIPTISVNKSFADNSSINFGFTERIRRPSIYRLNPFVDRSDPDFITTGNPNLRAVVMNILQVGYSTGSGKKVSVFIGSDYTFMNNLELQVTHYDAITHITTATYENTGKGGGVEGNFNMNYSPGKVYNLSVNAYALDLFLHGTGNDTSSKLDRVLYNVSISNGFRFNNGWSMNANVDYHSKSPTSLQGVTSAFVNTSLTVNKEVIKNKLFLSAGVNNPFTKFRNAIAETTGTDFIQTNNNQVYFRSVGFSLNYNFGKLKNDIKKSRKEINNDDVSKGGGL